MKAYNQLVKFVFLNGRNPPCVSDDKSNSETYCNEFICESVIMANIFGAINAQKILLRRKKTQARVSTQLFCSQKRKPL